MCLPLVCRGGSLNHSGAETYYIAEVDHAHERIERPERAIDQAIASAPEAIRAVIERLQLRRGVARISAATIVAELGQLSRSGEPNG
jgi:hypothetical protein